MFFIDPAVYAELGRQTGQSGVTVDEWMMRAFDYLARPSAGRRWLKAPPGRQHDFIQTEVERLAAERGWKPEEAQAAIWSAIKAAAEGTASTPRGST